MDKDGNPIGKEIPPSSVTEYASSGPGSQPAKAGVTPPTATSATGGGLAGKSTDGAPMGIEERRAARIKSKTYGSYCIGQGYVGVAPKSTWCSPTPTCACVPNLDPEILRRTCTPSALRYLGISAPPGATPPKTRPAKKATQLAVVQKKGSVAKGGATPTPAVIPPKTPPPAAESDASADEDATQSIQEEFFTDDSQVALLQGDEEASTDDDTTPPINQEECSTAESEVSLQSEDGPVAEGAIPAAIQGNDPTAEGAIPAAIQGGDPTAEAAIPAEIPVIIQGGNSTAEAAIPAVIQGGNPTEASLPQVDTQSGEAAAIEGAVAQDAPAMDTENEENRRHAWEPTGEEDPQQGNESPRPAKRAGKYRRFF